VLTLLDTVGFIPHGCKGGRGHVCLIHRQSSTGSTFLWVLLILRGQTYKDLVRMISANRHYRKRAGGGVPIGAGLLFPTTTLSATDELHCSIGYNDPL
jgi:hypothetical protein